MKKFALALTMTLAPLSAYAGNCHGTDKPTAFFEKVDVEVAVEQPKGEKVTAVVTESIVSAPASVGLVRRNANREARAEVRAAKQARRAAFFASKAADAVGQEARQEAVVQAYRQ
jgi:hypothetical protein